MIVQSGSVILSFSLSGVLKDSTGKLLIRIFFCLIRSVILRRGR